MALLDDQIEAAERALRAFQLLGQRKARRGKEATGAVELAMGMESVLRNLNFQKKYEDAFRTLARDLVEAERDAAQDTAIANVLAAFPGATVTEININDLEKMQ